ncbi:conserved membrane protein, unknown function [Plasmodium ovale wallikeri]|uniref:Uncharacterized protein n=1 Tax=Plasmodium ovale wallikeri TaxID=864142 RepID=A0A1A8YS74_PLAOA|nr:conserved membrane protein, unknown function [Plasmodium ovale wallikeri]SBT34495.1 conserved membrane protein, unknown function [Plasmodium ovale wallikeri]
MNLFNVGISKLRIQCTDSCIIIFQEAANVVDLAGIFYILTHKHTSMLNLKERILSLSNLCKTCLLHMWIKNVQNKKKINLVNSLLMYFTFVMPLTNKIILLNEDSFSGKILLNLVLLFLLTLFLSFVTKCIFNSQSNTVELSRGTKHVEYNNDDNANDDENDVNKGKKKKNKKKKGFFSR